MDNYFLVGYDGHTPVSVSHLGRRISSRSAVKDFDFVKGHILMHNPALTSLALYRGLCWSLTGFLSSSGVFELVEW
ncbi:MAG: hypothetical protein II837_00925 [Treponema sp.]|nr:hypothetical protein [Treponema sp.]MBQ6565760.1 hypothetical protein [Treponema sp.]MBQ7166715.1 hypothetical protein [Treponema sp.]